MLPKQAEVTLTVYPGPPKIVAVKSDQPVPRYFLRVVNSKIEPYAAPQVAELFKIGELSFIDLSKIHWTTKPAQDNAAILEVWGTIPYSPPTKASSIQIINGEPVCSPEDAKNVIPAPEEKPPVPDVFEGQILSAIDDGTKLKWAVVKDTEAYVIRVEQNGKTLIGAQQVPVMNNEGLSELHYNNIPGLPGGEYQVSLWPIDAKGREGKVFSRQIIIKPSQRKQDEKDPAGKPVRTLITEKQWMWAAVIVLAALLAFFVLLAVNTFKEKSANAASENVAKTNSAPAAAAAASVSTNDAGVEYQVIPVVTDIVTTNGWGQMIIGGVSKEIPTSFSTNRVTSYITNTHRNFVVRVPFTNTVVNTIISNQPVSTPSGAVKDQAGPTMNVDNHDGGIVIGRLDSLTINIPPSQATKVADSEGSKTMVTQPGAPVPLSQSRTQIDESRCATYVVPDDFSQGQMCGTITHLPGQTIVVVQKAPWTFQAEALNGGEQVVARGVTADNKNIPLPFGSGFEGLKEVHFHNNNDFPVVIEVRRRKF